MSWKTKRWNGKNLRSEDFVGAIEGEFESFMENGDVTLNQLKERCLELATGLADWVDEAEDLESARNEKVAELTGWSEEIGRRKTTSKVILIAKGNREEVKSIMKEAVRRIGE